MIFLSLSWNYTRKKMKKYPYIESPACEGALLVSSRISCFRLKSIVRTSLFLSLSGKKSFLWAWRHVIKGALVRSTRQLIVSRAPWFSSKEFPRIPILSLRSCKIRDRILAYGLSKNRFHYYKSIKIKAKSRNDGWRNEEGKRKITRKNFSGS